MNPRERNFAKSHVFDKTKEQGVVVKLDAPGIGGTLLPGQLPKTSGTTRSFGKTAAGDMTSTSSVAPGDAVPAFIAFDRKVLRFFAYFQEGVAESRLETSRFRKVKIYCYLEDDSMQINESKQDSSGIPQGTLLRRHQFPKPGRVGEFYRWEDLNLGSDVEVYGIVYHIVDCDDFTKKFFAKVGLPLNPPESYPSDTWEVDREAKRPHPRHSSAVDVEKLALRQFLRLDRKVLRFFCVWDDTSESFGDLRQFVLQYYLSDDTIQVMEAKKSNSGYPSFPQFLRRQRVPKVVASGGAATGASDLPKTACVLAADLMVGRTVNVYGRPFLLYDCDAFTKKYYTDVFGVTDFHPVDLPKVTKLVPEADLPPWDGLGSEEDTMENVKHLFPKPPKKDFPRMISFEGVIFRYKIRLLEVKDQDARRRFILSSFPADDTLSIYEADDRNSGTVTGKFLERGRYKPDDGDGTKYITVQDIRVGEVLKMLGRKIFVYDADDFTLHYKLGNKVADALVALPVLPGYPVEVNVEEALKEVREMIKKSGVTPAEIARQCESRESPDAISLQALRKYLIDWGITPKENTFLGLTAYFDPGVTCTASTSEFIEVMSK